MLAIVCLKAFLWPLCSSLAFGTSPLKQATGPAFGTTQGPTFGHSQGAIQPGSAVPSSMAVSILGHPQPTAAGLGRGYHILKPPVFLYKSGESAFYSGASVNCSECTVVVELVSRGGFWV